MTRLALHEMTSGEIEALVEDAYNEGWRCRESKPPMMANSRGEMRREWIDSNARDALLDAMGVDGA